MSDPNRRAERPQRFAEPLSPALEQYLRAALQCLDQLEYGDPSVLLRALSGRSDIPAASLRRIWTPPTLRKSEQHGVEVTIAEMLRDDRLAVVVLADPGHGKSTAGRYLMCELADRFLQRNAGAFAMFVPLRHLDASGGDHKQAIARAAAAAVDLNNHPSVIEALTERVDDSLLIFDGLDELPMEISSSLLPSQVPKLERPAAARVIRARLNRRPLVDSEYQVNTIVTSRRMDYLEEEDCRISGAVPYFLPAFLPEHVGPAITRWHEVAAEVAANAGLGGIPDLRERGKTIIQHLRLNKDLAEVCTAPMMLTLLQTVFADTGDLPSSVSQLCERAVSSLLVEKHSESGVASTHGRALLEIVSKAGYAIQESFVDNGIRTLARANLRDIVQTVLKEPPSRLTAKRLEEIGSQVMVHLMGGHGVLVWHSSYEWCEFTHNVLREVMAGIELGRKDLTDRRTLALDGRWSAPLRYWAGVQASTPAGVNEITATFVELSMGQRSKSTEAALARAEILSEVVAVASSTTLPQALRRGIEKTAAELVKLLHGPDLAFYRRARCGEMLALLGDPRLKPSIFERLVEIAGDHNAQIGRQTAHSYETKAKGDRVPAAPPVFGPLSTVLVAPFETTNTEYAEFISDGGYENEDYWPSEIGWRWASGDSETLSRLLTLAGGAPVHFTTEVMGERVLVDEIPSLVERMINRRRPMYWAHPAYNGANQPVVGVNWWEALAYCNWLKTHLRREGRIGDRQEISLPTEAEWEWTARQAGSAPYPWLGGESLTSAHLRDGGERSSYDRALAVGMFPFVQTNSPLFDIVGNVWEWTASKLSGHVSAHGVHSFVQRVEPNGLEERISRGSSWFSSEGQSSEFTFRSFDPPYNAYEDLGFRIVLRDVV